MYTDSREIRIKIHSEQYDVDVSLFSDSDEDAAENGGIGNQADVEKTDDIEFNKEKTAEPDIMDMNSVGILYETEDRISIFYDESEVTGLEGSQTTISFLKQDPSIISMTRDGAVSTNLVFEEGKRYHCIYKTPFMPFEICIRTIKVSNDFMIGGAINIDYIVEIRGANAERTKFTLEQIKTPFTFL